MKYFYYISYSVFLLACVFSTPVSSQVLNPPTPAANPNIGTTSPWTSACASEDFDEYFVNFTWSPAVNNDNLFILELSDANGGYTDPIALDTVSDKNTIFDFDFSFRLPNTIRGDGYTMRVRSTSPAVTGPASNPYAMYYIAYKDPILISRDRSGTIPADGVIYICDGTNATLATHNVPDYENYEYNWYRNGSLVSERSSEISITQAGTYSVEIDYGASCSGSANTLSNSVEAVFVPPLNIAISTASDTAICSIQTVVLESNITDPTLTFTWYKDGVALIAPTAGASTYTVDGATLNFAGEYYVVVQGENTCEEQSNSIMVSDLSDFEVTLDQEAEQLLLPTKTVSISVGTTAVNPTFKWYRNGVELIGETANSLIVDQDGDYVARVDLGGTCSGNTIDSPTTTVSLPDSFLFVLNAGDYAECSSTQATMALSQIDALFGDIVVDATNDLLDEFTYAWTLNGATLTDQTDYALLITDPNENGTYAISGVLEGYNVNSNELDIRLSSGETLEITSNANTLCDASPLYIETTYDLTNATFEWIKDGLTYNDSDPRLEVVEIGSYQLVLSQNDCPLVSNTIDIVPFDDEEVGVDVDTEFLFVQGTTVTVTATGATTYEWYNENSELVGTGNTFDVTSEGSYLLVASSDNCSTSIAFTAILRDEFEVPNVITPNGDGINDLWLLPNIYSGNPNIRVTIFSDTGTELFRQTNYQNNWPESTTVFAKQNMIFYYTIKENGSTVKQGTITVIK